MFAQCGVFLNALKNEHFVLGVVLCVYVFVDIAFGCFWCFWCFILKICAIFSCLFGGFFVVFWGDCF